MHGHFPKFILRSS